MIYVFYRPNSEHARDVEEFIRLLEKEKLEVKPQDVNTKSGDDKAKAYRVVQYPAVLAVRKDGSLIKDWYGMLPTMSDVTFFARSNV